MRRQRILAVRVVEPISTDDQREGLRLGQKPVVTVRGLQLRVFDFDFGLAHPFAQCFDLFSGKQPIGRDADQQDARLTADFKCVFTAEAQRTGRNRREMRENSAFPRRSLRLCGEIAIPGPHTPENRCKLIGPSSFITWFTIPRAGRPVKRFVSAVWRAFSLFSAAR